MQNRMIKGRKVLLLGAEPASLVNFRGPLLKRLVALGHDVHVASKPATAEQAAFLKNLGVTFHPVAVARSGMNPLRDLATAFSFYKLFRKLRPEALFSYTVKPVIFGTLAAWVAGVPHRAAMVTGLGYAFTDGKETNRRIAHWVTSLLYGSALPRCDNVLFQNPDDKNDFDKLGLLKGVQKVAVVNGSGVDTDHFATAPLPAKPVFLLMGRLVVDKGVRDYVDAVEHIRSRLPEADFRMLGIINISPHGITEAEVQSWKARGITYLPETDDVRPFITDASVVVLPSYREGTPRSVLEGMAMGRAIITTDVPGCRETVVNGWNGLLVPVRDAGALASAMLTLARDPERVAEMGRNARQLAVEKYKAEVVADDTIIKAGLGGERAV